MLFVFCRAGGRIDFEAEPRHPEMRRLIAKARDADASRLRRIVQSNARLAYDGLTHLVPGVPEAVCMTAERRAVERFAKLIEMRMAGKTGWPDEREISKPEI